MHVYKDGNRHGKKSHLEHWFSFMESSKHEYTSSGCIIDSEYLLPIKLKKKKTLPYASITRSAK